MAKQAIKKTTRARRRTRARAMDSVQDYGGSHGMAVSRPFTSAFTPDKPGYATLRTTFEAIGDARALRLANVAGTSGFPDWFPQAVALLTPFSFFRVTRLRFTTQITGGAASVFTVAGNVTNDNTTFDSAATSILNDDYAGVANALMPLVLEPPGGYWAQGSLKWYPTATSSLDTVDYSVGTICTLGFGGATGTTVLGWHTVDMEVEFHTLR